MQLSGGTHCFSIFTFLQSKNDLKRKFWCNYSKGVSPLNDKVKDIYIQNHLALKYHLSASSFWQNVCCNNFPVVWVLSSLGVVSCPLADLSFLLPVYSKMIILIQSSFHTTWASLFELELKLKLVDWNVNELECDLN